MYHRVKGIIVNYGIVIQSRWFYACHANNLWGPGISSRRTLGSKLFKYTHYRANFSLLFDNICGSDVSEELKMDHLLDQVSKKVNTAIETGRESYWQQLLTTSAGHCYCNSHDPRKLIERSERGVCDCPAEICICKI